ncbi:peptidase domain-containing ABC transporter [Pseudomarimonas arenosa]|uniref:Peptidase domain-containing ABC transporter n=1 Tax=Pseudomarimonas arenosa TaxID=2774145 RepID=A0AAW3ZTJ6_9GAMM|nr:peptidase domain-containing ABC transporter [Pseudomarimonas arenosa]MBD8527707.1 peptidase domain-containing ABC transporter [Pseudomarimonas arenosa]
MRVPLIRQAENAECGLACLAMVLGAYGDERGLAGLRGKQGVSNRGLSLNDLVDLAELNQLDARALRIELEDLRQLRTPAILHWNMSHFVVLVAADRQGIEILDPARGRRRCRWSEVSKSFSGVVLEIWPSSGFAPIRERRRVHWRRLLGPLHGLFSGLGRIALLAVMLELLVLVSPLFVQTVIDQVLVSRDLGLLGALAIAFSVLLGLQVLAGASRTWSITTLTQSLGFAWQSRLQKHLLRLPLDFFQKRSLGEVLSRFDSLQTLQSALSSGLVELVMDSIMAILVVTLMFSFSAKLAALTVGILLINLSLRALLIRAIHERSERVITAAADLNSFAVESVRGIQSLRVIGTESRRGRLWQDRVAGTFNEQLSLDRLNLWLRCSQQLLNGLERILIVFLGAGLVLQNVFTVGFLIAYLAYRDQFVARATVLVDRIVEFRMLKLHAERLSDITDCDPEPENPGVAFERVATFSARGLSFRYGEHDPWVIDQLDLQVSAGETLAIVGASGCGKSTLLKLLLGLLPSSGGAIAVNGRMLERGDFPALRRVCGVVMQDDQLFAGTIAENIAGFDAEPDADRIWRAAQQASIDGDIEAFPMRYHTLVGDMGASLSGGQKQRLLLARALYRQPQLLLLDEATSHLDVSSEKRVNQAVRELGLATIIIAHRPETIAMADRVVVLQQGRVAREYRPQQPLRCVDGGANEPEPLRAQV